MKHPTIAHFRHFRHLRHFNSLFTNDYQISTNSYVRIYKPFMQNKPNFMRFSPENADFTKKQTQFKPNKAKNKPNLTQFKANSNPICLKGKMNAFARKGSHTMKYCDLLPDFITLKGTYSNPLFSAIPYETEIYEIFQIFYRILLHYSAYCVILLHINEGCLICN